MEHLLSSRTRKGRARPPRAASSSIRLGLRPRLLASDYAPRLPAHAVKGNNIGSVSSCTASSQPEKAVPHRINSISAVMFLRLATASLSRVATQGVSTLVFLRLAAASLSWVLKNLITFEILRKLSLAF